MYNARFEEDSAGVFRRAVYPQKADDWYTFCAVAQDWYAW